MEKIILAMTLAGCAVRLETVFVRFRTLDRYRSNLFPGMVSICDGNVYCRISPGGSNAQVSPIFSFFRVIFWGSILSQAAAGILEEIAVAGVAGVINALTIQRAIRPPAGPKRLNGFVSDGVKNRF